MAHLLTIFTVISEGFCRGSRSFAREQVRRTTDPGLRLSRMTATTNNRFPTTTFGNDDNKKSHPRGFLSGICRSVREQQRRTTDSRLQHSGMTTSKKAKNKSKCHPRGFWRPAGFGDLLFIDWPLTGLKDPYKRVFSSGSKKGLTRFFFLIQYHYGPGRVI